MRKAAAAVWSGPLHNTAKDRPAKEPTRVLIVDDHPIVIAGCRALLADDAKIVITEAADAESGAASFTGRSARCLPYRFGRGTTTATFLLHRIRPPVWPGPERQAKFCHP